MPRKLKRYFEGSEDHTGITPSRLARYGRERQLQFMEHWFHTYFEDPAQEMPIDDGEFVYPYGGPYDAKDVLFDEFGTIVSEQLIDELAEQLERDVINWAPTSVHPDRADDLLDLEDDTASALTDIVERLEAGARGQFGDEYDRSERARIIERLDAIESALESLKPTHGGIGHNNPPEDEGSGAEIAALREDVGAIREELRKAAPDLSNVGRRTKKLSDWLLGKLDKFADSFTDSLGKKVATAVVIAPIAIPAWGSIAAAVQDAISLIVGWLQAVTMSF